jgi:protein-disulfide isomerase
MTKGSYPTMKAVLRMLTMALLMFAVPGFAQTGDTSVLRPPKGSRVAIMVFEDLECPYCARIEPMLQDAVKNYKIPLVRYDCPIAAHSWSFQAHVDARLFDTITKELGEEFRRWTFANQSSITKLNLRAKVERFATEHHLSLPTFIDPNGELAAKVKADYALAQKVGIDHTPTVYVVSNSQQSPYIEVKELSQLFSVIDQINAQLAVQAADRSSKPVKGASGKGTRKSAEQ